MHLADARLRSGSLARRLLLVALIALLAGCEPSIAPILIRHLDAADGRGEGLDGGLVSPQDGGLVGPQDGGLVGPQDGGPALWQPTLGRKWHIQLSGDVDFVAPDVAVYEIDLDEGSSTFELLASREVICYFSAGSVETFRDDASQFPASVRGNPVPDYPNESYIDISF